ncbi:hypothetical protein A3F37_03400 [Candidatus Saccharibacteria bacterium RIFCSPHIGHO2_12_FULL_41_12]|nr:MAG: hypothetical protein A3F37_03400 [Candidatus Saccharibacteria bacterium RIFCSPHIGHO2_12_FULL_41_12]
MSYTIIYSTKAQKEIKKLPPHIRKRIRVKLEFFYSQEDPVLFAKRLVKPSDASYRWRIGVYRVLFDYDKTVLSILSIQHRKDVYKK